MKTDNELIAEFIKLKKSEIGKWIHTPEISFFNKEEDSYKNLRFHESLDWLKLAIDKICVIAVLEQGFCLSKANYLILEKSIVCDIEELYEGVVEFIKWYNQQNK